MIWKNKRALIINKIVKAIKNEEKKKIKPRPISGGGYSGLRLALNEVINYNIKFRK